MLKTNALTRLLLLSPHDNIYVVSRRIVAGEKIEVDDQTINVRADVDLGHKLARQAIAEGEKVIKYGAPIGIATTNIQPGDHVHLHNMRSDYTPTYALDGGDI